jgi:hypothetical protein
MVEPKRKITPHKGNRDQSMLIRLTSAEKLLISQAAQTAGLSQADFLMFATRFYMSSKHFAKKKTQG